MICSRLAILRVLLKFDLFDTFTCTIPISVFFFPTFIHYKKLMLFKMETCTQAVVLDTTIYFQQHINLTEELANIG